MAVMKYSFEGEWTVELESGRFLRGRGTSAFMTGKLWFVFFNASIKEAPDAEWKPCPQKMVFVNPDRVVSASEESFAAEQPATSEQETA
jgi:hypothetical protein